MTPWAQRRLQSLVILRRSNKSQLGHPPQHVMLPLPGTLQIRYRVVHGWRLGQPGEHRGLGEAELLERFTEVDLRRGGKAVRALPQINLVHVQLEDLVLRQAVLDLEGEHRLVQLARQGLLRGQEEVARHLHGDRARALAAPARYEVGIGGAHHAEIVDAGVLVEALVLGREDGRLELGGNVGDRYHRPPLLAELADQHALGGVDPQRDLGLILRKRLERWEIRVGEGDDQTPDQQTGGRRPGEDGQGQNQVAVPLQGIGTSDRRLGVGQRGRGNHTPAPLWRIN